MGFLVLVAAILFIFIVAYFSGAIAQNPDGQSKEYPYRKLDMLFTPAERSFLGVLNQAAGDAVHIFGKVRVADVIAPRKGMERGDRQRAFNRISSKHFDFLLCDKDRLSVLCAIELNDSSHSRENRKRRDEFLSGACKAANVPLIQLPARAAYSISEIQKVLAPFIQAPPPGKVEIGRTSAKTREETITGEKACPKCSSVMVKRVAKKGENAGNEFWACSAFPKCRYIEKNSA